MLAPPIPPPAKHTVPGTARTGAVRTGHVKNCCRGLCLVIRVPHVKMAWSQSRPRSWGLLLVRGTL